MTSRLVARGALVLWGSLVLGAACSQSASNDDGPTASRGGNEHYGDDLIGYKNANPNKTNALNEGSPGSSGTGGSSANSGSGGSTSATGGDTSFAGAPGEAGSSGLPSPKPLGLRPRLRTQSVVENPYVATSSETESTFSIDVDGGSFSLSRAALLDGVLPEPDSVRVEEFLNYFHFHYQKPIGERPLSLYTELGACPWNTDHKLLMLGVQGQEVSFQDAPPANLVYLLDVSGSMQEANKLPLLKSGFRMLTRNLRPQDRVSIVTYAGAETVVLDGVSGSEQDKIIAALDGLEAGGSTNGAGGIQKAYELAQKHFIDGGSNRVLLATDGDFNVGLSSTDELVDFIATKRATSVYLSVFGFGDAWNDGNYQDEVSEQLADNGNGIYFFIDGPDEARRAFQYSVSGSLITVAKDVKLQVAFNTEQVRAYRLIGYENRLLSNGDFSNDAVDAGELGAGLSVTALYEVIPAGSSEPIPEPIAGTVPEVPTSDTTSDPAPVEMFPALAASDVAQVRIRYKQGTDDASTTFVENVGTSAERQVPTIKFYFASGLSELAMLLRGSQYIDASRSSELQRQVDLAKAIDGEGAVAEGSDVVARALRLLK